MAAEHEHEAKQSVPNDEGDEDFVRITKSVKDGKFYGEVVAPRGNLPDESTETLNQGYGNKADLLAVVAKHHPGMKIQDDSKDT